MKFHQMQIILFFVVACIIPHFIRCEFYTAIAEMEKLLDTEARIVQTLDQYLKSEEERLKKVKWLSRQYKKLHSLANKDVDTFLSNPVNAYLLVKRLTADWEQAHNLIESPDSKAVINNIGESSFPSTEDLSGAAQALIRLQNMYLLNTSAIASGQIKGATSVTELTAGDCYELGVQAYNNEDMYHCMVWMDEAWKRIQKEKVLTANKIHILEYLSYCHYSIRNYTTAIETTEKIFLLDPHNPRAPTNLNFFMTARTEYEQMIQERGEEVPAPEIELPPPEDFPDHLMHPQVMANYEKLCRGESVKTKREESKLKCYYTTNDNSYLLLQPVKVEVLNAEPRIVMFYDVITDKEANSMKAFSLPMLERATVNNGTSGELIYANYRISKSTWLHDIFHPMVPRLNQRLSDITGMDTAFAEPLHIINYGIGGFYEPHFDFAKPGDKVVFFDEIGNRIATWIYYLSDVPAGGSTVFPDIGVEVKPIKGAAVFWHNLFKSGRGDKKTRHAACPVLAGSKWIANKWLHEKGNEFRRRCSLDPNE